ncbi:hypothetical protein [Klebsiella quasipneumoniae]|uniref:Phage protein n=1 Tax=Klebsiella quasipneumoniae TaxID=1463165 RepID=A0ABD7N8A0_9ENTR|nr:hypothetical protein [Klebsiella quasipneumoniae]MBD7701018.1 hypothetical protein [Klebsiella pneumoniae]SSG05944.1 Uncharacterised protein [Klebsiella quasipneumoniae]
MKKIKINKIKIGQAVTIRTHDGKTFRGILTDRSDWLVGCPVVKAEGKNYGIGYDAEIVGVPKEKNNVR